MNKNCRILPQLNDCFLQKKAYQVHRKKIESIRHSLRNSLIRKEELGDSFSKQKKSLSMNRNNMSTIKEQPTGRYDKMQPFQRRKFIEYEKENCRLIRRIQTCSSTINRKDMELHMVRSKQRKNRLCKYKYDPGSKKTELKSVHSYYLLQKVKERDFDGPLSVSRRLQKDKEKTTHSKSLMTKISRDSSEKSFEVTGLQKKNSFDKLISRRNLHKINVHFGKNDFVTRAKAKLEEIRKGNSTQLKRKKKSELVGPFWKSRCFTTQVENYH